MDDIDRAFNPTRKMRWRSRAIFWRRRRTLPDYASRRRFAARHGGVPLTPVVYLYPDRLSNAFARWAVRPILTMRIWTPTGTVKQAAGPNDLTLRGNRHIRR
jgi:hypothetical protein